MAITQNTWAKVALPDPSTYYGGYKDPRLLTVGQIKRALSDRLGQFENASFEFTISDHDRLMRGKLAGLTAKWIMNQVVIARMIDDDSRRALLIPRTVAIGKIRDYQPTSPFQFTFTCEDYLATYTGLGTQEAQIPKRTISLAQFPTAPAETGVGGDSTTGKTFTTPHPSIPIPPCPGYVQLSDQARDLNQTGTISNGTYGLCDARGWIMYDGNGDLIPEGWAGHSPPVPGDVTFASPDVAAAMEPAAGGSSTLVTVGLPVPIIYGEVSDAATTNHGQCPGVYVGDYTLTDGRTYHKFVIAGHACKAILGIYSENLSLGSLTTVAGIGGDWVVPGYALWTSLIGANLYEDLGGQRFTVVYGLVGNRAADVGSGFFEPTTGDSIPLSFNVQGIETVGNGTGSLITDGFTIYLHFLRNWAMGDYQTGAWPSSGPVWPNSTVEVLDDASFPVASAVCQTRISGGYTGAVIIGADEAGSVRDWIQRFNQSLDCFVGMNRKSQFFVRVMDLSLAAQATAHPYRQTTEIFDTSFSVRLEPIENVAVYSYLRDFSTGTWLKEAQEFEDAESILNIGERRPGQTAEMWLTRTQAQADDVAQRRLLWAKEPPKVVTWRTDLTQGLTTELGDLAGVTHVEGLGPNGWTDNPVWVCRHELDPDTMSVTIEAYDVDRLFAASAIFGNESVLPGTWGGASVADREYFYLCDEVTGLFSDGSPGKRLR